MQNKYRVKGTQLAAGASKIGAAASICARYVLPAIVQGVTIVSRATGGRLAAAGAVACVAVLGAAPVKAQLGTPAITTTQLPATAMVGNAIADSATISGGINPTGKITFILFNNPNGTGTTLFTDTENLLGGMATSASYTATGTGADYWVDTYSGDSHNNPVTSSFSGEPVLVTPQVPSITTTQLPATAMVGNAIADSATISGGFNPTGTITFMLFNNPTGTGTPLFTSTEALVGDVANSAAYITSATGTDYWVDTYSGDSNNVIVTSGGFLEPVTVTPAGGVPEPATLALLGIGLGGLAASRRRKQ